MDTTTPTLPLSPDGVTKLLARVDELEHIVEDIERRLEDLEALVS